MQITHDAINSAGSKKGNILSRFVWTYVFATDHKIIGLQFLFSSLIWMLIGGLFALAIRWQLAWPWTELPILGRALFAESGGQMPPDFYNMLFTLHAPIMIYFVVIPIFSGAFGNYLIPLMIGAENMAFPRLNMLSYWFMWPAFACMILSILIGAEPSHGGVQQLWVLGLLFVGIASMMGSINSMTTILQMRAPGLKMFLLPMTVWGLFIAAIIQAFALPVSTAALLIQLSDQTLQTGFFIPNQAGVNPETAISGGRQVSLWQHVIWFYSHPAVYVMILPAMGMVSDMLACFSRKPLFGYRAMVYSMFLIAGLCFIVWGHHMFVSGMNGILAASFMVSMMLIAIPSGIMIFNWLGTIWGSRIHLTTPMLFSVGFVAMFVIGVLSGVVVSATPFNVAIHDTHYVSAHLHYVLFGASVLGIFAAIYFWFPKMFGRTMNETLGKLHFLTTFIFLNGTFFPMYFLGPMPRRYADPYNNAGLEPLQDVNIFITYSAMLMGLVQFFFVVNFFYSLFFGKRADRNPWRSNTLEWTVPNQPSRGNFEAQPLVYRGPYDYGHPDAEEDFWPQTQPPR